MSASSATTSEVQTRLTVPLRRGRQVVFVLLGGLLATTIWNAEPLHSANDRSRWATVRSLVDLGTYRIDDVIEDSDWDTIDKVRHEGHFYSTKPALLPTMTAGLYWMLQRFAGWQIGSDTALVTQTILLLINLLPFLAGCWCLSRFVDEQIRDTTAQLVCVPLIMLATMLSPFLVTMNNHTVAATGVLLILLPWTRIMQGSGRWWHFALTGALAAWICVNELPAAALGVSLFVVSLQQSQRNTWLAFVPAALLPLGAFFLTTWLSTGGWKPFYMYYGQEQYEYVYRGVPSYWMNPTGIDVPRDTPLQYFIHCTVGHHGILSLTPLFVFMLPTWFRSVHALVRRQPISVIQTIHLFGVALTVIILAFYLSRTENYNYGGNSAALRWALWLVPFWLLAVLDCGCFSRSGRIRWSLFAVCIVGSIWSVATALDNPWKQPWLFHEMQAAGWVSYEDEVPEFNPPIGITLWSLPEDAEAGDWVELSGIAADGRTIRVRITDRGRAGDRRVVEIAKSVGQQEARSSTLRIDERALDRGRSFGEVVDLADVAPGDRPLLVSLLSGLPEDAPKPLFLKRYLVRYLFTGVRDDAFRCRRVAIQQVYPAPDGGNRPLRHRADLWLSEEVPFGLVRWERSSFDAVTGDELGRLRLSITGSSRFRPRSE